MSCLLTLVIPKYIPAYCLVRVGKNTSNSVVSRILVLTLFIHKCKRYIYTVIIIIVCSLYILHMPPAGSFD